MTVSQRPAPQPLITPRRVEGAMRLAEGVAIRVITPVVTLVEVLTYPARFLLSDDDEPVLLTPLTPGLTRRSLRRINEGVVLLRD